MIKFLPHEELGNIVTAACNLSRHIHIGLAILAGNILVILKSIKILIVLQSILLGVIINDSIIIMVIPQIITILLHLLCHGDHKG